MLTGVTFKLVCNTLAPLPYYRNQMYDTVNALLMA